MRFIFSTLLVAILGSNSIANTTQSYVYKKNISNLSVADSPIVPPVANQFLLSTDTLNFGSFYEGQSNSLSFLILNTNTTSITPGITTTGNFNAVKNCTSIAPSQSCLVNVDALGVLGSNTGSIAIATDGVSKSVSLNSIVLAYIPDFGLSSNIIALGDTVKGTPKSAQIILQNNGIRPISSVDVQISNQTTSNAFTASTSCSSVPPGASCLITGTASAQTAGSQSANMTVTVGALAKQVTLTANVTDAQIEVTPVVSNDYGAVTVSEPISKVFTIKNTGTAGKLLNISATVLNVVNGFEIDLSASTCQNQELSPNQTCTVSVKANPSITGAMSATLNVTADATTSKQINLTGTARALTRLFQTTNTSGGLISSVDFGSKSTSSTATFRVSNSFSSTGTISVSSIAVDSPFEIVSASNPINGATCATAGLTLPASASCDITVKLNATLGSYYSGYGVTFTSNALTSTPLSGGNTVKLPLTGSIIQTDGVVLYLNGETGITDTINNLVGVNTLGAATAVSGKNGKGIAFDGATYVSMPSTSSLAMGTSAFTAEFWMKSNVTNNDYRRILCSTTGRFTANTLCIRFEPGVIRAGQAVGAYTITPGTWYHIAYSRINGTGTLFINGQVVSTAADTSDYTENLRHVGGYYVTTGEFTNAVLDDITVTKGYAKYTANFSPTAVDPYWANVSYLMHFEGANGSTSFVNSKTTGASLSSGGGSPVIATSDKYIGNSSLFLNGTSSYISNSNAAAQAFSNSAFTVEANVKLNVLQPGAIFGTGTSNALSFYFCGTGSVNLCVAFQSQSAFLSVPHGISVGSWNHVALVRSGNTFTVYVNGISKGTAINSGSFVNGTVFVGRDGSNYLNAYIDELRVSSVARYTFAFTPTTVAHPEN